MTNLKKMLAIVALFSIQAAKAKVVGKKTTTTPPITIPEPAPEKMQRTQKSTSRKAEKQPTRAKTFEQLYYQVKNAKNAWGSKTQRLSNAFLDELIDDATTAQLTPKEFGFLLDVARDFHAQFTSSKKDIDILNDLIQQRIAIITIFEKQGKNI